MACMRPASFPIHAATNSGSNWLTMSPESNLHALYSLALGANLYGTLETLEILKTQSKTVQRQYIYRYTKIRKHTWYHRTDLV